MICDSRGAPIWKVEGTQRDIGYDITLEADDAAFRLTFSICRLRFVAQIFDLRILVVIEIGRETGWK